MDKISDLKNIVINTLDTNKAEDIVTIDLKDKSSMADYMIIASGTSSRHIQSLSEQVLEKLKDNGIKNSKNFINDAKLQERVFLINVQRNKWILRRDIKWFVGTIINETKISESGIIAAAHLAGPGNVKKYLRSGGKDDKKDAFGTSISKYIKYFQNFDLSMVEAVRKPKV